MNSTSPQSKFRKRLRLIMALLFILSFPAIPFCWFRFNYKALMTSIVFCALMFAYQVWENFFDEYEHRRLKREMEDANEAKKCRHNKTMGRV